MTDETHIVSDAARRRTSTPPDEAEAVQRLVERQVANVLGLYKAEIDLVYRVRRYRELAERCRALRSEEAEVRRQMRITSTSNNPRLIQFALKLNF